METYQMADFKETHRFGNISLENLHVVNGMLESAVADQQMVDVGIQIAHDGRIWLCVNGVAFIRFKPDMPQLSNIAL